MTGYQYSNSDSLVEEAIDKTKPVTDKNLDLKKFDPDDSKLDIFESDIDLKDLGIEKFDPDDFKPVGLAADKNNALGKSGLGSIPNEIAIEPLDKDALKDFKPLIDKSDFDDAGGIITSKNLDGSTDSLLIDTDTNNPQDLFSNSSLKNKPTTQPINGWNKDPFVIGDLKNSIYGDFELQSEDTKAPISQQSSWIPSSSNSDLVYEPFWKSSLNSLDSSTSKKPVSNSKPTTANPVCIFDEKYYLAENPDVAQLKTEPLNHYLLVGKLQGRSPSAACEQHSLYTVKNTIGSANDDILTGNDLNNNLSGKSGNDLLKGGRKNDTLLGDSGNDTLVGCEPTGLNSGKGEYDLLTGGKGADTFVLGDSFKAYYLGNGYATITDFDWTEGDRLRVFGSASDYSFENAEDDAYVLYKGDRIANVLDVGYLALDLDFQFA